MEIIRNEETPEQPEESQAEETQSITLCLFPHEVDLVTGLCDLFWDTQSEVATMEERGEVEALRDKVTGGNRNISGSISPEGEEYLEYNFTESQAHFIGHVLHEWTIKHKQNKLSLEENKMVNEVLLALFG